MDGVVMVEVGAHIAASVARPYEWGRDNCALWVATGLHRAIGFDPAADLRGRCASRFMTLRMVAQAGGLVAFVRARMVHPRLRPLDGDGAAVITAPGQAGPLCAFILGGRAVARTETGVVILDRFEVLEGWSWSRL